MTIHRAKGLEFDHVVVPGLHRVSRIDDSPPILWRPEAARLLLGVRGTGNGDGVHRWLSHEERHRDANERIRLLYVAATRARRSLSLFGALEITNRRTETTAGAFVVRADLASGARSHRTRPILRTGDRRRI